MENGIEIGSVRFIKGWGEVPEGLIDTYPDRLGSSMEIQVDIRTGKKRMWVEGYSKEMWDGERWVEV